MLQQLCPYRHAYLSLYQVLTDNHVYFIFSKYLIFPNNYYYSVIICDITMITLICICSHICSFISLFSYFFLYNTCIHIFFYHLVLSSYHICNPIIYHECIYALLYSYIHIYIYIYIYISLSIHIPVYHLCIISFMRFYHELAIHVLYIFLSCMLLLIHVFLSCSIYLFMYNKHIFISFIH